MKAVQTSISVGGVITKEVALRTNVSSRRERLRWDEIMVAVFSSLLMGFFVFIINGCSPMTSNQRQEEASRENVDRSQSITTIKEKDNTDVERLARVWEKRKQEYFSGDYPIGPGDVIEVNVAGMDEIKNLSERITGEGTISLPFVGVINVNGMTDKSLRAEIRRRLETNYMRNPQVSLFVKEFRSRQVAVIGAVNKPGVYNLASSSDTILGMISQAGGMRAEAAAERLLFFPAEPVDSEKAKEVVGALPQEVVRQDPSPLILKNVEPIVINLDSVNRAGNEMYLSIPARPGDVIMVPGGGEVLIQGWVEKPGSYKITPGLTVLGAVAAAGGPLFAGDTGSVKLIRTNKQGEKTTFTADLDAIVNGQQPDLPLREGDVIDIASSGPKLFAYGFYRFFTTVMRVGASVPIPLGR